MHAFRLYAFVTVNGNVTMHRKEKAMVCFEYERDDCEFQRKDKR